VIVLPLAVETKLMPLVNADTFVVADNVIEPPTDQPPEDDENDPANPEQSMFAKLRSAENETVTAPLFASKCTSSVAVGGPAPGAPPLVNDHRELDESHAAEPPTQK
jgi:hypothetical protein